MSIGMRLDLRQTQQLVMTPQLQQAIKLLQMSNLELTSFIEQEVEKNPLLKLEDAGQAPDPAGDEPESSPLEAAAEPAATDKSQDDLNRLAETYDTGTDNLHDSTPSDGPDPFKGSAPASHAAAPGGEGPALEERLADRPGLREHLHSQIGQMPGSPIEIGLAHLMADELDEHGFLRTTLEELANRVSASPRQAIAALKLVQNCEPTGVGARSLAECLELQLREQNRYDPVIALLLDNLELVARGEIRRLCRICEVDEAELIEMIQELRNLNPRPCAELEVDEPETLIPDLLLRPTRFGGWSIELNPETLPRVLIDRHYLTEIRDGSAETKHFLGECHANANWLVRSLDQRARTIVKIATEIVRQQEKFFREGIRALKPMNLKDVADAVDMHESTASRVTSNKYIATDRGIFELKFFFTNGLGGGNGSDVAAEAVRHRIKSMVDAEQPTAILSDDAIVSALNGDGIQIARRTVAKYRKTMNIPSSSQRRRQKASTV